MKFLKLSILSTSLILSLLLLFLISNFYPDPQTAERFHFIYGFKSDEEAEATALQDFNKGRYRLLIGGENIRVKAIRDSLLSSNYGIEVVASRCVTPDEVWCYTYIMENKLADKFGVDFYQNTICETMEIYRSEKLKESSME